MANGFTQEQLLAEQERRKAQPTGPSLEALQQEQQVRSRRAEGGQQPTPTLPSAPAEEADPLANVPTEIEGVTLSPDLRQAVLEGRGIKDPKEKRLMAARIAGRIAAQSKDGNFADDLMRGQFGAGLRGFGAGVFGLGDLAAAGGTFINSQFSDNEMSFGEALEAQREFRRALEEDFPLTSGVGEIAGALTGGGAAGLAVKAVTAPTKIGKVVSAVTSLQRGQRGRNVLRLAGAGATGGAITEGITEGDPVTGAQIGAIGGPAGAGFIKAAGITLRAGKDLLADPAAKGLKALAKSLDIDPGEVARRFLEFEAVMGTKPAIADIANPQAVAELRDMIGERAGATAIAREGAEAATQRRGGQVAEAIGGPRVTTTATAQKAARTRQAEEQFRAVEDEAFEFSGDQVQDLLSDPDLRRALPPSLKRRMDDILADVEEGDAATLSGLDVNDIRQALRGKVGPGQAQIFKELADEIEAVARPQSPAFGRAIDEFARRSRTAEGVVAGRQGVTARTGEFAATVGEAAPETQAGIRAGIRSELTDVAQESAARSIRLSRSLAEDSGLSRRLKSILKPDEFERLQAIGRVQSRSAENVAAIAPGVRASENKEIRQAVNAAVASMALSIKSPGPGFIANTTNKIVSLVTPKINKRVAENIARDVFDPEKTGQVLSALRRAQVPEEEILDLFATAVASPGVLEGAARTTD